MCKHHNRIPEPQGFVSTPQVEMLKKKKQKHTYGTVQSYKTSAHILRYQASDPKLEEGRSKTH